MPTKFNFHDMAKDEELTAVYLDQFPKMGRFKKNAYEFLIIGQKEKIHLWGSSMLNNKLYGIPFGSLLKIKYFGKEKTPESTYPVHIYAVEILQGQKIEVPFKNPKEKKNATPRSSH